MDKLQRTLSMDDELSTIFAHNKLICFENNDIFFKLFDFWFGEEEGEIASVLGKHSSDVLVYVTDSTRAT